MFVFELSYLRIASTHVYEAKHHQKSSQTLMLFALPYSPLCIFQPWPLFRSQLYSINNLNLFLFQITINDLPVGRDVDETIRLVQAFKFTDEHGEVCPAGWKPGKKTMKPNAEGVAKYLGEN